MISIDDFKKCELRVGSVMHAERVEGSDKLLKLLVDVGFEKRQILAGVGKNYEPAELVGRDIVVVVNLEPRNMMGLESQGMILAASSIDGPVLLVPEKQVPPGSEIR